MKLDAMFPRRYASGEDLQGRAVTVTIQTVRSEKMRPGQGRPEETKYVLYTVEGKKGIILSRVLAQQIIEATGESDTDNWEGKKITVYPEPMQVAGRSVVAIRAKAAAVPAGNNGNGG